MERFRTFNGRAILLLAFLLSGCALPAGRHQLSVGARPTGVAAVANPSGPPPAGAYQSQPGAETATTVSRVSHQAPADPTSESSKAAVPAAPLPEGVWPGLVQPASPPRQSQQTDAASLPGFSQAIGSSDDPSDPFSGQAELSVEQLAAEVQARNPSLRAASEAWRAAAERYPQVVSLDDPMFTYMITPTNGLGMDGGGWMVQASQKIPWAGKRTFRGGVASAEANVMQGEIGDTRLRLAEAATVAFFEYYMARRQIEVNAATQKLVRQLRRIALDKYQVNQVTEQDVLQADVELAELAIRSAELTGDQQVAQARINTLLHREADHPLPPPLEEAPLADEIPDVEHLLAVAVRSRPDLYAQVSRIQAEEASLALACREYYPDLNVTARYDGFMPEPMRPQVGMDITVPIRYPRRSAAVREASARIRQRRAEYQNLLDQARFEVQSSFTRVVQAAEVVRLYRDKTLPAAQRNLQSAQANYTTGALDFLSLLDAERQLNNHRERYYAAIAEYHQRLAELERAVGSPVH